MIPAATTLARRVAFAAVLLNLTASSSGYAGEEGAESSRKADGYRGIWFDLGQRSEYGSKYSGGLGTYTAKHIPLAVYVPGAHKTFFVYGGTTSAGEGHLLAMVSYYDHERGVVPRPTVVHDKGGVDDPHDNPSLAVDGDGHLWVFVSGRGRRRPGFRYRSTKPLSIEAFERVAEEEFTYPQPWWIEGKGFLHLFTKYTRGRELYWASSPDGRAWSEHRKLAGMGGHYQVSAESSGQVITAFSVHPGGNVDRRTNLYFVQTTDLGASWRTAAGEVVETPMTETQNAALVRDYRSENRLVYLKDINFDGDGRPAILYITSGHHAPGPGADPRLWTVARWRGDRWSFHEVTGASHNYDMGSLHVEADGVWTLIAPTERGPQPHGTGGEMALWTSRDAGASWRKLRDITRGSRFNHGYARRARGVSGAHPDFFAFWADGDPDARSESRLYFTDRTGTRTRVLPCTMTGDFATPQPYRPGDIGEGPLASPAPDEASGTVLLEDSFSGELVPGWSWVRESPEDWRLRDGALELRVRPGNLWGRANDAKNIVLRDLPVTKGTVGFEVSVSNEPSEQWEQAGIAWYRDDSNMVKLVKERVDGKPWVVMGREEGDRTRTLAKLPLATSSVRLRLEIHGGEITGRFRAQGEEAWSDAAGCDLPGGPGRGKISLQVYNGPAEAEHWARFSSFRVTAAGQRAPSLRESIGVNIHFTGSPERDLELLEEAGFGWVRMDFAWQAVEREKGRYRFEAYDQLVEGLTARGIRALFILDYSNRLYETARSVRTGEGRAAFARFAAAAAARYRGKGIRWEIWNEPNHEKFWTPEPSAAEYLELVRAVSPAIRAADPQARILGPATSGIPREFLEALFANGFLDLVDELSVHPYRSRAPETVRADYARLRSLMREHVRPGSVLPPIVSGEWGYSNHHWGRRISSRVQAAYLVRQFLTNLSEGVPLSIWYDWANDGRDLENTEHNFGTVTAEREPKPAYLAVKTLTATLGGARFEKRLDSPALTHVLCFVSPASSTGYLAAWSEAESRRVRIVSPGLGDRIHVVDLGGAETVVEIQGDALEFQLGPEPRYLRLPEAVARQARLAPAR